MATYRDIDGTFKAITSGGAKATVGEIVGLTVEETGGSVETTAVGDSARTRDTGLTDYTLSGEFHYDPASAPQEDLAVGTKIDFDAIVQTSAPAAVATISGTAVVTQVGMNVAGIDEVTVKRTFTALGDGALSKVIA